MGKGSEKVTWVTLFLLVSGGPSELIIAGPSPDHQKITTKSVIHSILGSTVALQIAIFGIP